MTLRAALVSAALFPVVIVTAATLAGCSGSGSRPPGDSPSPSPAAASTGPADWWIRVNPCGLLTQTQLTFMGLPQPGQPLMGDGPGRANECEWGTTSRNLTITLSAHPYTDLFFHTGRVSAIRFVDGRLGELDVDSDGTGGCQLTMQTVNGSSALVFATGRPGKSAPWTCRLARRVASLIRPHLPSP
jgi:hypothetical protein